MGNHRSPLNPTHLPTSWVSPQQDGVFVSSPLMADTPEITLNDLRVAEQTLVDDGFVVLDDVLNSSWPV